MQATVYVHKEGVLRYAQGADVVGEDSGAELLTARGGADESMWAAFLCRVREVWGGAAKHSALRWYASTFLSSRNVRLPVKALGNRCIRPPLCV
jgi:hypothetical protein